MVSIDQDRDGAAEAVVAAILEQRAMLRRMLADVLGEAGPTSRHDAEQIVHYWQRTIMPTSGEVAAIIDEHQRAAQDGDR